MTYVKVNSRPLSKSFNNLLDDFWTEMPSIMSEAWNGKTDGFVPANIDETNEGYDLELVAPGFTKEDFNLKLEDKMLTIEATYKSADKENKTSKNLRKEYRFKNIKRSFHIDEKIDPSGITASYRNGILYVTLPKKAEDKAVAKEITVQ